MMESYSQKYEVDLIFKFQLMGYTIAELLSSVWLFVTLRTVAHQAPLCMGLPRQEYWGGLLFPLPRSSPPRDWTHTSRIAGEFFAAEPLGEPHVMPH